MNTPLSENCPDMPFLIPTIPCAYEKCAIYQQLKLVINRLPIEVQTFLYINLVDPFFVQLRQNAGDPKSSQLSKRLILLYQCIKRCQHEDVPYAICAISIVTGLPPKVILDHNRLHLPQNKLDIIQAFHAKASRQNPEPVYAFSGRIEVTKMSEYLPSTLLWTLSTNPLNNIEIPDLSELGLDDLTDSNNNNDNTPKNETEQKKNKNQNDNKQILISSFFNVKPQNASGNTKQNIKGSQNSNNRSFSNDPEKARQLFKPFMPDELPNYLTEQEKYYLLNPRIRKDLKSPFFFSRDLSNGFNPAHGLPPVPCYNEFDDQQPPLIRWIADLKLPDTIPATYKGCKCINCDCRRCHVLTFDDNKKTMRYTDEGKINLEELNDCRPLIIECNEKCLCDHLHCKNRVVQNRSRVQLMVIRSKSKSGWGVRTMEFIPKGSFVCEYLGQVISDPLIAEMMGREYDNNLESYLFDLDAYGVDDDEMLTVDPSKDGNVSKYINHSCDPNLVQISIGNVESPLFHRIAFFAARNIYPNEELGFHYNYEFDENQNRFIECNCGCINCRTRLR